LKKVAKNLKGGARKPKYKFLPSFTFLRALRETEMFEFKTYT
jgi:hypothetical protein